MNTCLGLDNIHAAAHQNLLKQWEMLVFFSIFDIEKAECIFMLVHNYDELYINLKSLSEVLF